MRNLTKTLVAVSLLTSTSVHSLGIGGIKLRSALNQKLNAEIALVTSGNENVGDIQVKLASPAKFDEAGVPWSYFLTKIKFSPFTKADGSVGVKLSSNEALKEPYLDFLVEVTGPNGTLFREFTVLVDPPKSYVSSNAKKPDLPIVARLAPKSELVAIEDYEEPRQQTDSSIGRDEAVNSHASGNYDSATREYGPTQESDTIWSIANEVKPDNVSTAQMVAAIYRVNPQAFSKANVNTLLAGKILRIPAHNAILKLARQQAAIGFKQSGRRHAGLNKPKSIALEPGAKVAKPVKHLKLEPPIMDAQMPQAGDLAGTLGSTEKSTQNRAAVDAAADADLKLRFEKIEQQLQMMEKLLSIKDAELARLQKQSPPSDIKPDAIAPTVVEPVKTEPATEEQPVDVAPVTDVLPAAAAKATDLKPEVAAAKAEPVPSITPPIAAKPALEIPTMNPLADYLLPAGGIGASLLAALGLIWWRKRKVEKTIDTESMFASASQISMPDKDKTVSALTEQVSGYEVGTVGDSTFLSEFTPSEFDAFETDQTEIDPLSEADVYLAYGRYQQAEELIKQVIEASPNRNDCKLKLLEIYHTSENKIAFDQYVEVLAAEGKQADTAFWTKVTDMSGDFKLVPPVASATLGKAKVGNEAFVPDFKSPSDEFDFDLQSFAEMPIVAEPVAKEDRGNAKPVAAVVAGASSIFKDELEYPDFSNDPVGSGLDFELKQYATDDFLAESSDVQSVDFDFSASVPKEAAAIEANEIEFLAEADGNGLDFDLSAFGNDNRSATVESIALIDADETNSIEFDLAAFGENLQTPVAAKEPQELLAGFNFDVAEDALDQTDFDLSDELDESLRNLDFSTAGLNSKKPAIAVDDAIESSTDFDFDFDFNLAGSQLDKGGDKLDLGGLADADSHFDKVDLANAYVDMGDVDAAKDIARDLLKGSAEQKKAGKEILEKIS